MKLTIVNVGRVRQKFVLEGETEYLKRIRGNPFTLQVIDLGIDAPESLSAAEIQKREASELTKRLADFDWLIVLDERGKQASSEDFAKQLSTLADRGTRSVALVIGGAHGFAEDIRNRADLVLSLSRMTMPHQLTRLVLVEQLYRAHTLIRGLPYHK